jgi:hypothetical protein
MLSAALLLTSGRASADVAPPLPCGFASHKEVLHGRRCVADGFHLILTDGGQVATVADDGSDRIAPRPSEFGLLRKICG